MWWVGERLLTGSVQGAFVIALVWLVCRNIAAIPASARAFLWWLASLKLALALMPLPSLPVPLLPSSGPAEAGHYVRDARGPAGAGQYSDATSDRSVSDVASLSDLQPPLVDSASVSSSREAGSSEPATARARTAGFWLAAAIGLWLAGVTLLTLRLLRVYATLRSAVRGSTPLGAEAAEIVDRLARLLGLRKTPEVRVSDRVTTPLVAGLFRPTVLIPAQALATLSPGERAMAICHELAHVRRRDLLLGWVPALAERLFFFHPLARLAAREYVVAREAACDTLVLRAMGVAPQEYGRMLVRLGVGGLDPAFMAAGSSPSMSSLKRRLDMLQHLTFTGSRRRVIGLLVAVSALTFVPLRLVARTPPQPQVPAAAPAPVPVGVSAERQGKPSAAQEVAQAKRATPSVSTEAFLAQAADDALRRAEAEYRKMVEEEYRRTAENERTDDFLKKEYETKVNEYKTALLQFTGNQESTEADRLRQQALAQQRTETEQLRRQLEEMEKVMKTAAELRQRAEEARRADREAMNLVIEAERRARAQAGTLDTQTGLSRQLEALTLAQQTLVEQLKNLVAQQEQLATMQRQLSTQVEIIRRELERATKALAPAAPGTAAPAK
jgi:beta-lactamase regulating signal transducer with metallopeptidase domain